jgi:hypothetical protein
MQKSPYPGKCIQSVCALHTFLASYVTSFQMTKLGRHFNSKSGCVYAM